MSKMSGTLMSVHVTDKMPSIMVKNTYLQLHSLNFSYENFPHNHQLSKKVQERNRHHRIKVNMKEVQTRDFSLTYEEK